MNPKTVKKIKTGRRRPARPSPPTPAWASEDLGRPDRRLNALALFSPLRLYFYILQYSGHVLVYDMHLCTSYFVSVLPFNYSGTKKQHLWTQLWRAQSSLGCLPRQATSRWRHAQQQLRQVQSRGCSVCLRAFANSRCFPSIVPVCLATLPCP